LISLIASADRESLNVTDIHNENTVLTAITLHYHLAVSLLLVVFVSLFCGCRHGE